MANKANKTNKTWIWDKTWGKWCEQQTEQVENMLCACVKTRVTIADKKEIQAIAERAGISVSELMRQQIRRVITRHKRNKSNKK